MSDAHDHAERGNDLVGTFADKPRTRSRGDESLSAAIKQSRELIEESKRILAESMAPTAISKAAHPEE